MTSVLANVYSVDLVMTEPDSQRATARTSAMEQELSKAITELFEHKIVFNEYLGFRYKGREGTRVLIEFDMRPELVGHYMHGRLHGGVISTVLDAVGGLAVLWAISDFHKSESVLQIMERFKALATIDLRVDYLRPGVGERFTAESEIVRLGRRIAATSSRLSCNEGKTISTANATYIVS